MRTVAVFMSRESSYFQTFTAFVRMESAVEPSALI